MTYELSLQQVSAETINSNFTAVEEEVNSKAQKNGDSTQKFNVADATETTEAINKGQLNTAMTTVNTSIAALETEIATKANSADVNSALALKANTTDVNSSLDLKANQADVTTALAEKADTTYVDAQIAAVGNKFPDYANGVSKSLNVTHTAQNDGWLLVYADHGGVTCYCSLVIEGKTVFFKAENYTAYNWYETGLYPISAGQSYIMNYSSGTSVQLTFLPIV